AVAPARRRLVRPRRRLHTSAASAAVLLALDLLEHVLDLDDVDELGLLVLPLPGLQLAAAARAGALVLAELEELLLGRQTLVGRPVPLLRLARPLGTLRAPLVAPLGGRA